jgi:hypothetical protein
MPSKKEGTARSFRKLVEDSWIFFFSFFEQRYFLSVIQPRDDNDFSKRLALPKQQLQLQPTDRTDWAGERGVDDGRQRASNILDWYGTTTATKNSPTEKRYSLM